MLRTPPSVMYSKPASRRSPIGQLTDNTMTSYIGVR